jgi:zinc/manganese transport system substrate-binding protein
VVEAAAVVGASPGDDPHLWYSPTAVQAVGEALTAALTAASPGAADAFRAAAADWQQQLQPYRDEVAAVRAAAAGRTYAATETVFDRMAAEVGLTDVTPAGYRAAASNDSEPAPGDVAALQAALREHRVDVLVLNTQTQGSVPDQLRGTAEQAGVPVVPVTESPPAADVPFVSWQVGQLQALAAALGSGS